MIKSKFYARLKRRNYLNMYTLLGLINTDGNINMIIDTNQKLINPRITLTARASRSEVLLKFKTFLFETFGINSSLNKSNDEGTSRGDNLVIDRIKNVSGFIEAVEQAGSVNGKPVLFGKALREFLTLKRCIQLSNDRSQGKISTSTFLLKCIDLNDTLRKDVVSSVFKTREDFESTLGFTKNESLGAAAVEWEEIFEEAKNHETIMVNHVKQGGVFEYNGVKANPNDLLSFVCGVFAGDGSFQVNIFTHTNHGPAFNYRKPVEFNPLITVTDLRQQDGQKPTLFCFLDACLGVSSRYVSQIQKGNNACRFVVYKQGDIKVVIDYMLNFEQPFIETEKRLRFTGLTLALLRRLYQKFSKTLGCFYL